MLFTRVLPPDVFALRPPPAVNPPLLYPEGTIVP
jgi:hypothetical protein